MTYSEMKDNRKALEREKTSVKFDGPMTYSEMKPISNIINGKDTLFNDISSFGKTAMGDNPFSSYFTQGYKSPEDYTAASNYVLSSIDSLKNFKDLLNKNRSAYEKVYGADAVKGAEDNIDNILTLYNSQEVWDDMQGRRDVYGKYKDADEYDTLTNMSAARGEELDRRIAEAQEKYDNASSTLEQYKWLKERDSIPERETKEKGYRENVQNEKDNLERLKQLKLDWEDTRANYDDEGNSFALKYTDENGNKLDLKSVSLAEHKLATSEYKLSDSEKRELKWLREHKKEFATNEELENMVALAEGQAQNARAESDRLHRVESSNRAIGSPEDSSDAYEYDPYTDEQKAAANETAAKYEAKAATLKSYSTERKADEKLKETEQAIYNEYMPLLDDPEFVKHTERESSKIHQNGFGSGMGPNYKNEDQVYSYLYMFTTPNKTNQRITDEEAKIFVGLYNTQGKNAAKKFLNALEPIYNARVKEAAVNTAIKDTKENPIVNELMSFVTSLMQGLATPVQYVKSALGEEIDTNSQLYSLAHYTSAVRGTTSQMLEDELRKNPGSFWNTKSALAGRDENGNYRAIGLFAKETAESMIDNLARIAVSKGVGKLAGGAAGISEKALKTIDFTLMGSQVATQTIIDAKERGLSDGKALAMGLTSGAIEAITEVWSIERVLKNPKNFITTLGKSLVAEGSEEIASNILNRAVDVMLNADQSEVMQEYYQKINQGMSTSEASASVIKGIIGDDLSAGLGGALSGIVMSGTNYRLAQSLNKAQTGIDQIKVGRQLKSTDKVITALDEIIKANPNNTEAIEAKAAIEKGEKVSSRKLGKLLVNETTEQFKKAVSINANEVKEKLEAKGIKNADSLSRTIAKAVNKGSVSGIEDQKWTELTGNAEAMEVFNEYKTAQEAATESVGRLNLVSSLAGREQLLNYAKEQGKSNSFLKDAVDLAEGKSDLESLQELQKAVETEMSDRFLSADTVEEAQDIYKELSKGASKDITKILDYYLDDRTNAILEQNKLDKIADVSFKNTRDGVVAYIVTDKMVEEANAKAEAAQTADGNEKTANKKTEPTPISVYGANIGSETKAVIDRATAKPAEARSIYANEYINGNRYLSAESYDRAFNKYYEAGKDGKSFGDIKRSSRDIKADSARRIYEVGRKAAENESKSRSKYKQTDEYKNRSKTRTEANEKAKKKGGVIKSYAVDKKISRLQRQQLRVLDQWARQEGITIRVVESLSEKIKLDGKIINGLYSGGNVITIALDGKNMLTSTAGHELYHMIKELAPEHAEAFRAFVVDHLKEAGEYDSVFGDYERRYKNTYKVDESFKAKIEEEIVADHCFEALTNKNQWEKFAGEHKSIAEKIIDFIKEFVAKINNAFDKYFVHDNAYIRDSVIGEADYMNKIADMLWTGVDKAVENYRSGAVNESGETKYSIEYTTDNKAVAVIQDDILKGVSESNWIRTVKDTISGKFPKGIPVSGRLIKVNRITKNEFVNSKDSQMLKKNDKAIYKDKYRSANNLDDIVLASTNYINEDLNHTRKDNFKEFARGDVLIRVGSNDYSAEVIVGLTSANNMVLYDIIKFTPQKFTLKQKKMKAHNTAMNQNGSGSDRKGVPSSNTTVTQGDSNVNTHSMQNSGENSPLSISDADYLSAAESGNEKTAAEMVKKAAEEKFKDSVIRDDDGNLLKVYHGRVSKFNVFDRKFATIESDLGKGFYFSSQEDDVDSNYANNEGPDLTNKIARLAERIESEQDIDYDEAEKMAREQYIKSEPNTVEAYLNVKNPAIISNDNDGTYLEYNENYDEETDDYGDPEGSLVDFVEALESAAEDYESFRPVNFWEALGDSIYDGGISLKDAISLLKESVLDELSDENGDLAINEVIRQAIEDIGFDGVIDKTVSEKFPNMQGMYSDTTHYIVFDSSQIKSADPITYDDSGNIIPLSERFNSSEKDIRYSISKKFYNDFDKWNGKNPNITFEIGNTSDALQSIGIKNQKIIMRSGMVLNKLNKHSELSRNIFRQIPELLERPVIVQFSDAIDPKTGKQKYDSRITVLGELYTQTKNGGQKSNNPVLVSIELLPQNQKATKLLNVSIITSVYAKNNLQRYIDENSILYIDPDKKRTNKWLSLNRLQLPVGENRLGSVRKITYIDGKVKIENSKTSTPMQAALEKAGIVNSSGISLLSDSENDTDFSDGILSDDQRGSISDAGMRLTDNAELSSLMRDNADYKAEIERLKGEFVKSKRMGGKGANRLVQADINRVARSIIGEYSSEISFYDLKDMLTGLYGFLANNEKNSWDYAYAVQTANDIAKSVIAQSFTDITPEEFADYKKALRSYRLIPNLQDVSELTDMFGTFAAAYRQYGKKLNMRAQGTENAFHIDEIWDELCEAVPLLDRNADSTQEMWRNLIEVRDSLDERTGFNPYLEDGELSAGQAAALLGADILERFNEVSPDTTFADRAQQRVDLREQKISELKAEKQEALSKLREQRDTRILKLKESFRQQNQNRRERNAQTIDRQKIRHLIKRFKNIYNHGSKDRNVKAEMRKTVEKVLESANFLFADEKTGYDILAEITPSSVENKEQRAALRELQRLYDGYLTAQSKLEKAKQSQESGEKSEELLNRISEYEKLVEKQRAKLYSLSRSDALSGILAEKRAAANRQTVGKALQGLYDAYCELKKSELGYIRNAYNDVVAEKLKSIAEELSDKNIRSMSEAELSQLYDAYKMVYHTMTTQNKLFKSGKKQTVEQAALTAMDEMKEATKKSNLPDFRHPLSQKALSGKRSFEWSMMTPYTAFQKTGSKVFTQMYFDFIRGQDTYARDIAEAKETLNNIRKEYGYDNWNLDKATTFTLDNGQEFTVTLSELMAAYAISRREQGRKHIENGGFVFSDNKKGFFAEVKTDEKDGTKKKRVVRTAKEAYRLTENDMNRMFGISDEGGLTGEQRRFVEDLQDYLTKMGEKGNEVSRQLYGIDIFKEKVYFPLESDRDFLNMSSEQGQETLLKNSGMTKETVKNAKNPIVLRSFEDVWSGHINKMALYHGFVLPIENLNRVLSFTPYLEEDTSRSVKTTLKNIFGEESVKYFEGFSRDLNGGTVRKAALYELPIRLISRFKKTAVAANLSVEIQQATAIVRAMAEIDGKYFANTPAAKENKSVSRFKEIQKYAPIAIIKEMGGFDTGSGRAATDFILAREYEGKDKIKGFFTDRYFRDELFMLGAAKADEFGWSRIWDAVKREIADTTDLEFNSKEFLEKCGERFTEVIVKTQVYDSTLSRSAMMRSDSEIMKMATAFMGEPTTSVNMLYRASIDIRRGEAGAIRRFARVTAAVYGSIILGAVFKSLVGAGRDDDDESFWDKYLQALARNLAGDLNPLTMLPFVKDIVEIIDGNDVTRQDLEVVTSFFDACEALSNEDMSLYRKLESFVGGLCNFAGLPVKNIMRDIRGIYNTVNSLGRPSTTTGQEVVSEFASNIPIAGKASAANAKQASKITAKYEKAYKAKDLKTMKKLISDEIESERQKLLDKGADPYEMTGTKGKRKNKVNSDARGKVRAKFTEEFKERYVEAFDNKDVNTVAEIKSILSQTGLYDDLNGTLENWRKEAKEKKEQEKRAEERKKSK